MRQLLINHKSSRFFSSCPIIFRIPTTTLPRISENLSCGDVNPFHLFNDKSDFFVFPPILGLQYLKEHIQWRLKGIERKNYFKLHHRNCEICKEFNHLNLKNIHFHIFRPWNKSFGQP